MRYRPSIRYSLRSDGSTALDLLHDQGFEDIVDFRQGIIIDCVTGGGIHFLLSG